MKRAGRITIVTVGLVAAGIVFGALAGGTAFAAVLLLAGERISIDAFRIGAWFGAPLGALTAPILSWLLLRHVPIGKMFLVCSIGTAIGGVVGSYMMTDLGNVMLNPLVAAVVGCVIAAIALRYRVQHA